MDFKGKVVFISGGTKGIGRAIAVEFAKQKASLACCYHLDENSVKDFLKEIGKYNAVCRVYKLDAGDYAAVKEVVRQVEYEFGKIDILVNNAGIVRDSTLLKMSENEWDMIINNNLKSVFNCTKRVIEGMKSRNNGKIINVSSIAASKPNIGQSNYAASKGAIESFTRSAAVELARYSINVNCIAPGCVETSMFKLVSDEIKCHMKSKIPLKRFADPAEIAKAVLFLASDDANYITGNTLVVDGGLSISLL